MAKVEQEWSTYDAEHIKAIAAREEVTKALRELEGQREALAILKMHTEGREMELACREMVATKREEAATQREGVLCVAEAKVRSTGPPASPPNPMGGVVVPTSSV
ncbi:hypothetical protein E2562_019627 [Oryza meyeriana var. granulata]|uniref:Uncharacterized protein n=1 Tax=Oryza meyeriana var. granulata TaxID=110450 RepID=A0A6G1C7B2_9ORYZ|nr:hypothetical protein E2562_019627 [Oryza meyeriana var. granulata]